MQYIGVPSPSAGADLIIELAREATPEQPLWVAVLGAATNTASALLMAPEIAPNLHQLSVNFLVSCGKMSDQRERANVSRAVARKMRPRRLKCRLSCSL